MASTLRVMCHKALYTCRQTVTAIGLALTTAQAKNMDIAVAITLVRTSFEELTM